jgi:hypothetical protein
MKNVQLKIKIINNYKGSLLFKRIREAFNTSSLVLSWGKEIFKWKSKDNLPGSNASLLDQIWEPFLLSESSQEIRDHLSNWKTVRGWLMKILGASDNERKILLSSPPKGTKKWTHNLLNEWISLMPPIDRKAWMTALFSTRSIILEGNPNYSTIIQDSLVLTPDYRDKVCGFWRKLRIGGKISSSRRIRWSDWHLTSKQGPNGPALVTLVRDFMSLPENAKKAMLVLGGPKFGKALKSLELVLPWIEESEIPTGSGRIRKVSNFGDSEGKTRIIAVLDYFSQASLRPIHSWLFRILKRIPQDFTFNQGGFKKYINNWEDLYSCDLTAATDRFPIKIISQVLLGVFPQEFVSAWEEIMVGYPFDIPGSTIRYSRGNPMGAYSSWSSFAVAHHFLMYLACENIGQEWHTAKYAILGDDILIGDTILYFEYRKILKDLDVGVSEAKTHESKTLCEFAKRWIYQGEEITPFPIPAMIEAKNYSFLAALMCQEKERGYEADIPESVNLWFRLRDKRKGERSGVMRYIRNGHYTRLAHLGSISESLIKVMRLETSWEEVFINGYTRITGNSPLPYMDQEWINSFWGMFLRSLWLESSDQHMRFQETYHKGSENDPQKIWLDIIRRNFDEIDDLIDSGLEISLIPWTSLAGQLTATADNSYYTVVQLLKGKLSQLEGWEAVRRLVLPNLATTFRERKHNVIRVLAGKLSSDLAKIFMGQGGFTILTSSDGILNIPKLGEKCSNGRRIVKPLDSEIPSDLWIGNALGPRTKM